VDYTEFLQGKRREWTGQSLDVGVLPDGLAPFQQALTRWACRYEAVRLGRRFLGVELKPEYAEAAANNLTRAEQSATAQGVLPL